MGGRASWHTKAVLIMGLVGAVTVVGFSKDSTESTPLPLGGAKAGGPRLISVEPLPEPEGEMCAWAPASANLGLAATLQQGQVSAARAGAGPDEAASQRKPLRVIHDPSSSFSTVAVDPIRNEVVLTDENLHGLMVYDRLANTPATAAFTEPKRAIIGSRTKLEYQCGLYIDPSTGDIYSVNNDTVSTLTIFSRQANGNVPPAREVTTTHGTYGIAVDEGAQELYLTDQINNAVEVFKKMAQKEDAPVRLLQGDRTRLADPHGITLDTKNRLIFVVNHGGTHSIRPGGRPAPTLGGGRNTGKANWPVGERIPGSGKILPPSINVYALDAQGDTPPLRTIEGPNTQLNWPAGIAFDPRAGELYIANDMEDAVLVFSATASGNVAPVRTLKGPKSLIKNPTGVFVDTKNDELWVANFGNHTATVYKSTAAGDTPPLRVIRSAPLSQPAPILGNPGSVAYDSKRDELLVPN